MQELEIVGHFSRSFLRARSKEELLPYIRKEAESGKLSSSIASGLEKLVEKNLGEDLNESNCRSRGFR